MPWSASTIVSPASAFPVAGVCGPSLCQFVPSRCALAHSGAQISGSTGARHRLHLSPAGSACVCRRLCYAMLCYAMCVNRAQVALAYTPKPPELVFDIELISFRCIVCTCGCYKSLLYRQQLLFKKQTLNLLPYN
jgi:hypothetical protein